MDLKDLQGHMDRSFVPIISSRSESTERLSKELISSAAGGSEEKK